MLPHFRPGDTLLGWHWFKPRAGQVVIAAQAGAPVIKRIERIEGDQVWLVGDNPADSRDSRTLGPAHLSSVEALVIWKLP